MSDYLEEDYRRIVSPDARTHFLPDTAIEIVHEVRRDNPPEHVLFDFDGTLSLIREGWPEVMVPMMVECLLETGTGETPEELERLAHEFVMELNGKQTIYQMIRLAAEIEQRGGTPRKPAEYKQRYHELLMARIGERRESLEAGRLAPRDMLVPGSLDILCALRERGVRLYLASGTDEMYVKEEAGLLGLEPFFDGYIYGAIEEYRSFSKAKVIERILDENGVAGESLLGFGDGYVEIQNVKAVGGAAVAVASDESGRSGRPDAWKRDRLIGVGADVVIPDFREHERLLQYFWGAE